MFMQQWWKLRLLLVVAIVFSLEKSVFGVRENSGGRVVSIVVSRDGYYLGNLEMELLCFILMKFIERNKKKKN